MTLDSNSKANALYESLATLGFAADVIARAQADAAVTQISSIGLDSKDLLALDFQLEEDHGLNIQFNDIRDDMTIVELIDHISETEE